MQNLRIQLKQNQQQIIHQGIKKTHNQIHTSINLNNLFCNQQIQNNHKKRSQQCKQKAKTSTEIDIRDRDDRFVIQKSLENQEDQSYQQTIKEVKLKQHKHSFKQHQEQFCSHYKQQLRTEIRQQSNTIQEITQQQLLVQDNRQNSSSQNKTSSLGDDSSNIHVDYKSISSDCINENSLDLTEMHSYRFIEGDGDHHHNRQQGQNDNSYDENIKFSGNILKNLKSSAGKNSMPKNDQQQFGQIIKEQLRPHYQVEIAHEIINNQQGKWADTQQKHNIKTNQQQKLIRKPNQQQCTKDDSARYMNVNYIVGVSSAKPIQSQTIQFKQPQRRRYNRNIFHQAVSLNSMQQLDTKQHQQSLQQSFHEMNALFDQKFFTGRISLLWIFIISHINPQMQQKFTNLYSNFQKRGYVKLLCVSVKQASRFFVAENSYFNVVVDVKNAQELISQKWASLRKKIFSIYLYNDDFDNGMRICSELKCKSRRIKGCYDSLGYLIDRARLDIDNGNKFVDNEGQMVQRKYRSKFPTLIKLNPQYLSQLTEYRLLLYGAIKLKDQQQRIEKLDEFVCLVERIYHNDSEQLENLSEYVKEIDHVQMDGLTLQQLVEKHKQVLTFYVRETFYYKILNNLLRVARNIQTFRPLILPFNQNYNAIKCLYDLDWKRMNDSIHQVINSQVKLNKNMQQILDNDQNISYRNLITIDKQQLLSQPNNNDNQRTFYLFRGASISENQLQSLRSGDFIQLLGCISASLDFQFTKNNFIKNHGDYLFIFLIKQRLLPQHLRHFDHGYVYLNHFNIVPQQFKNQQQVLLNALNVYKVIEIIKPEQTKDKIGMIFLQYGAVFDLLNKPQQQLSENELMTVNNYRYCMREMGEIKDEGDVLMRVQQFDKCKQFNLRKINQLDQREEYIMKGHKKLEQLDQQKQREQLKQIKLLKIQHFNKLSNAHLYCGQTQQARLSAIQSLEIYDALQTETNKNNQQIADQIFHIHQQTLKVFKYTEDTPSLVKIIDSEIKIFKSQNYWLGEAQKLMQRGEIELKEGKIIQSQKDLKQSQQILQQKRDSFQKRRNEIHRKYLLKGLAYCLCLKNSNSEQQKQVELKKVQEDYEQYQKVQRQVDLLLLKVNECLRNVAEFVGDRRSYERYVKKGREYFAQISNLQSQRQSMNKYLVAESKVIQAKVQHACQNTTNIQNSYKLINQAVQIVENINPKHEKVAEYSVVLGKLKIKQFHKSFQQANQQSQMIHQNQSQIKIKRQKSSYFQSNEESNENPQKNQITLNQEGNQQQNKQPIKTNQKLVEQMIKNEKQEQEEERQKERENNFGLYNQPQFKPKYLEIINYFTKALNILLGRKTYETPEVLQIRNDIAEVQYQFSNFQQSRRQVEKVLKTQTGRRHSQGAKSALLLAKISLCQGLLKQAFLSIQKAHEILRLALVKQSKDKRYEQLYQLSPIFLEIELYKCKVFNRQKKHDLALKSITYLVTVAKKKLKDPEGVGYLANIYEEKANTLFNMKEKFLFEQFYEKAIKLRQNQMGKYNMLNAISYCSLAKHLVFIKDERTSKKRLQNSFQIFSRFSNDHPNNWVYSSTMAFYFQLKEQNQNQLSSLRNSVRFLQKRYSKTNIVLLKTKVRFAQVLLKNNIENQALKMFEHLKKQIDSDLRQTEKSNEIKDTDNQKIIVRDNLGESIRETRIRITQSENKICQISKTKKEQNKQNNNKTHENSHVHLITYNDDNIKIIDIQ